VRARGRTRISYALFDTAIKINCSSQKKVRLHRTLAFDFQLAPRLECKIVTEDAVCFTRDMDAAGGGAEGSMRLAVFTVSPQTS
jgi:hypothetical protein